MLGNVRQCEVGSCERCNDCNGRVFLTIYDLQGLLTNFSDHTFEGVIEQGMIVLQDMKPSNLWSPPYHPISLNRHWIFQERILGGAGFSFQNG